MKKLLKSLGVVLIFLTILLGCEIEEEELNPFVGTWEGGFIEMQEDDASLELIMVVVFTDDMKITVVQTVILHTGAIDILLLFVTGEGTYTYDDSQLTVEFDSEELQDDTIVYSFSNNDQTLTIYDMIEDRDVVFDRIS